MSVVTQCSPSLRALAAPQHCISVAARATSVGNWYPRRIATDLPNEAAAIHHFLTGAAAAWPALILKAQR